MNDLNEMNGRVVENAVGALCGKAVAQIHSRMHVLAGRQGVYYCYIIHNIECSPHPPTRM